MSGAIPSEAGVLVFPQRPASSNRRRSASGSVASVTNLRKETASVGMRVAMLNMMLDAAILAARKPTEGADIAFDDASTNAIVSAIEGARRALISARSVATAEASRSTPTAGPDIATTIRRWQAE